MSEMERTIYVVMTEDIPVFGPNSGIELQGEPFRDVRLGYGDGMLQRVMLPETWTIKPITHRRFEIIDPNGLQRAIITGDESGRALIWPSQRFKVIHRHVKGGYTGAVLNGGKEAYTTGLFLPPENLGDPWPNGSLEEVAKKWLVVHYPKWEEPGAYWDE